MTEEERKNSEETLNNTRNLKEELKDVLFASRDIAQEAKNIARDLGLGSMEAAAFKKAFKETADISKNLSDNADRILQGQVKSKDIEKEINKNKRAGISLQTEISQLLSKAASQTKNLTVEQQKEIANAKTQTQLQDVLLKYGRDMSKEMRTAVDLGQEQLGNNSDNIGLLKQQLIEVQKQEAKLGVLAKAVEGIGKIPILGQFLESEKILTSMREKAAETGSTRFSVMGAGLKEIGKQINENMLDPFVMFAAMLGAGLSVDQRTVELERSLGVSRAEAFGLVKNFETLASSTNSVSINTLDIEKSFKNLQEQFGTASTILRDDIVVEMAELGKLTNMSAESQANFARFANISGKNAAVITEETRQAVVSAEQEKGLRLDINKVLDQAGKINGQIAAQLGGNVTAIASAVAVAKQFGMELEAIAASGAALLNFEQSISNELEAELLIGKQINLERARLAALTGDYETLTREINANVGDFGDFTEMNVLQQQALAQSVGMTADQLSDVLLKNANIAQLAQEARDAGKNDLADQLEKRSVQEQFNDTILKLKQIFVDIASGPIMVLVESIGSILSGFGKFLGMIGLGKNGITDFVVQAGLMAVMIGKAFNLVTKVGTAFKSIKATTMAIKANTFAINAAERLGLIRRGQANVLRTKEVMLQKFGNTENKIRRIYENQSLGTMIKRNAAALIGNVREKGANTLKGIGLALENAKLGSMIAQGFAVVKNIAKEGILLGIKVAQAAAALVGVSAATLGVGTIIAIAAAAAGIAYLNSISKADDMMSPPEGNSGYGSRMLLAPEGKFALNNKDTVIAGTNLFKADDIAMGNEGSINIDKISSNNQQSNNAAMDALNSKFDALINATQTQTQTIQNKPVAQNTMIDPNSIVNPRIPFEKSSNYTAMT
jgi:hypothetical protein